MVCNVSDFGKDRVSYNIAECTREELDNRLHLFFTSEKLPLHSENTDEKIYRKGNPVIRFLFGAFVKYFKLRVTIHQLNNLYLVTMKRDMGFFMSGGLIGRINSRKEFERLNDSFKIYFNS